MYTYRYNYGYNSNYLSLFSGAFLVIWIITFLISVFNIICLWKIFVKAGKPGWAAIIPIYNIIVLLEITELPMWYIVLFFIPIANIVAIILIYIELAHRFSKSTAFGVGLVFLSPIFMAILAFDKNTVYQGSVNTQNKYNQQQYTNNEYNEQSYSSYNQIQTSSSYCSNCGTKLDQNQKFCSNCGKQIF